MTLDILYEYRITIVTFIVATGMALTFWDNGGRSLVYYLSERHPLIGGSLSTALFFIVMLITKYFSANLIDGNYLLLDGIVSIICTVVLGGLLMLFNPYKAQEKQSRHRSRPEQARMRPDQGGQDSAAARQHEI
jgi:hypothetical protein